MPTDNDHTEEDRDNCRTASSRNTTAVVTNLRSRPKPGSRRVWDKVARGLYGKLDNYEEIKICIWIQTEWPRKCNCWVFFTFHYNQPTHNYITTVSLCNLHCYTFRHCRGTTRQFTANILLSYTRSANWSCWITLSCSTLPPPPTYVSSPTAAVDVTIW